MAAILALMRQAQAARLALGLAQGFMGADQASLMKARVKSTGVTVITFN